ncbi:hypothetical protein ACIPW5_25270 [Streptomyces sp. NPDC090077]|uniref:hypothetical protein n=1 Tax=Streptomyces sp. NPDC090077 TaxID=3365938 RepID=UPI00381E093F
MHLALLERPAALGATTAAAPAWCETLEQVQERIDVIAGLRGDLPFGIDGVVVKADAAEDQRRAGNGSRAPRWAVARRLAAEHKVTRLLTVEWNVGRTGIIARAPSSNPSSSTG